MDELRSYIVPGMSCAHCVAAVEREVSQVADVDGVAVDLDTKVVTVRGRADDAAVRAAIQEAGYEAE